MVDSSLNIRCQRCGKPMELKDPAPGQPWTPLQFWTCAYCGRNFWSTYPSATGAAVPKSRPKPAPPKPPEKTKEETGPGNTSTT